MKSVEIPDIKIFTEFTADDMMRDTEDIEVIRVLGGELGDSRSRLSFFRGDRDPREAEIGEEVRDRFSRAERGLRSSSLSIECVKDREPREVSNGADSSNMAITASMCIRLEVVEIVKEYVNFFFTEMESFNFFHSE